MATSLSQQQNKTTKKGKVGSNLSTASLRRPDFRHVPLLRLHGKCSRAGLGWVPSLGPGPGAFEAHPTCGCRCIACGPLFLFINPSRSSFRFLSPFRVYASPHLTHPATPPPHTQPVSPTPSRAIILLHCSSCLKRI
jgi:hypothetical protein